MAQEVRELTTKWGFRIDLKPLESLQRAVNVAKEKIVEGRKSVLDLGSSLKSQAVDAGKFALALGAIQAPLTLLVKNTAELGDRTAKLADSIGVSVEFLQEFTFAAERGGVSTQGVSVAMLNLARRIAEAAEGTGPAADAFKVLGISAIDAEGNLKGVEEILPEMADGFTNITSGAQRAQVAFDVFGKVGVKLLNVVGRGSGEIAKLQQEFRDLGGVMEEKLARQSEAFQDALTNLQTVVRGLRFAIVRQLLPGALRFIEGLRRELQRNLPQIQRRILQFFAASRQAGRLALEGVKAGFRIFGLLADIIERLAKSLEAVRGGMLAFKLIAIGLGAALFPVKAALLALLLVLDDVAVFLEGGDSLLGDFVNAVGPALDKIGQKFKDFFARIREETKDLPFFKRITGEGGPARLPSGAPRPELQEQILKGLEIVTPGGIGRDAAESLERILDDIFGGGETSQPAPKTAPTQQSQAQRSGPNVTVNTNVEVKGAMTEAQAQEQAEMVSRTMTDAVRRAADELETGEASQ